MNRSFKTIMMVFVANLATTFLLFLAPNLAHAQLTAPLGIFESAPLISGGEAASSIAGVATPGLPVADFGAHFISAVTAIKEAISAVADVTSATANDAMYIKAYVLDPLAFIASGNALRAITAGVVNFVNGNTNGTGRPGYVQDLQGHLRTTSDAQAFAFFASIGRNSNSPFASTIASSLRTQYLQGSSAAGFWAANRCTLSQYSPNINSFLAGNFSQGGWGAWFALTTQPQNNPYSLYYRTQQEYSNQVANAVTAQLQQLSWGQGFLSWCGPSTTKATAVADTSVTADYTGNNGNGTYSINTDAISQDLAAGNEAQAINAQNAKDASLAASEGNCPDGSKIQTPGSVIHDALSKALGSDVDKLTGVGTQGEISGIFNNLATIINTIGYGAAIINSVQTNGLFGLGKSNGTGSTYLGASSGAINQRGTAISQQQQQLAGQVNSALPSKGNGQPVPQTSQPTGQDSCSSGQLWSGSACVTWVPPSAAFQ